MTASSDQTVRVWSATTGVVVSDQMALLRSRIPPQETGVPENLIDLSDYYILPLIEGNASWYDANPLSSRDGWFMEFNNVTSLDRGAAPDRSDVEIGT